MGATGQSEFSPEEINHQASQWLAKIDRGLDEAEVTAFHAWLSVNSAHSDAIEKHKRTWKRLDILTEWRPQHGNAPNPDLLAPVAKSKTHVWGILAGVSGIAAALLLLLLIGFSDVLPFASNPTVAAAESEIAPRVLPDGSTVFAHERAEYAVEFSDSHRRITLLAGEVYFNVEKDPARPFVVSARGVKLTAVGTAFNVRLGEDSLELLVEEGRVALSQTPNSMDEATSAEELEPEWEPQKILDAFQRAIVKFDRETDAPQVESLSKMELKREIAWQHRKLHFHSEALDEVLAEFNRLNDTQLVLADPELAGIEISGTMHSSNLQGFIRLLEVGFDMNVEERVDGTILLSRSTQLPY